MRRLFVLLALAATLAACDFEQVIDLDVPPYEARLVLGGFPTPDSVFSVRVGRSVSALAPATFDPFALFVPDARVALFDEDGAFLDSLAYRVPSESEGLGGWYRSVRSLRPEPGHAYTLRIEAPSLPPAEAATRLPEPPPFSVRFEGFTSNPPYSPRSARLVVVLTDPPGAQTYSLRIERPSTDDLPYRYLTPFHSSDPVLRESFDRLDVAVDIEVEIDPNAERIFSQAYFRDVSCDGQTHEFALDAFAFDDGTGEPLHLNVVLSTLDDDYVRYQQTLALQNVTGDNPFAEPVRIHSNVEGGLGVFAGYTSSRQRVDLE